MEKYGLTHTKVLDLNSQILQQKRTYLFAKSKQTAIFASRLVKHI